ncbi:MAG TPA: hypothetical protein VLS85_07265 [Hanamia sp.]|nr:hypothetical protein [Hanamia sp.]
MKTKLISMTAIAAVTLIFGCKKANNSNSNGVSYQLKTTNRSTALAFSSGNTLTSAARVAGGTITWTSGYASAEEIKFEAEGSDSHVEFHSETPQKIDLFSPLASLGNINIPTGVYDTAQFEIDLAPTTTDAALELHGTYNTTPVTFILNKSYEFNAEIPAITVADGQHYNAVTALNLATLTQGISGATLDAATKDSSGTIVISDSSNVSIYDSFISNLHDSEQEDFE